MLFRLIFFELLLVMFVRSAPASGDIFISGGRHCRVEQLARFMSSCTSYENSFFIISYDTILSFLGWAEHFPICLNPGQSYHGLFKFKR